MSTQQMDLEQSGAVVTARLHTPEVTHLQMQQIIDECLERMRCHNASFVILDMAGVEFMASACLGPLVSLCRDMEHVRGKLALVRCTNNVAFLFRVTRLDAVFGIFDDEEEALASFK